MTMTVVTATFAGNRQARQRLETEQMRRRDNWDDSALEQAKPVGDEGLEIGLVGGRQGMSGEDCLCCDAAIESESSRAAKSSKEMGSELGLRLAEAKDAASEDPFEQLGQGTRHRAGMEFSPRER